MKTNFKISKLFVLLSLLSSILLSSNVYSENIPCPNLECEESLKTIQNDLPEGTLIPYVSNPIEDEEELQNSFTQVTNQLKPGSDFFSFISDEPTPEELRRVEITERMARSRGFSVHRIIVPIHQLNLDAPKKLAQKVSSYFGTQKINLSNTPQDIAKLPTPSERVTAKLIPIKNMIVKPIAWSAHAGPVGAAAVTAVSVIYSYFTSTYWHMFRVFFNHPHFIGEGTKLGDILEKINLVELGKKFGLEIKNQNIKDTLTNFNAKKFAGIVQYATKMFAYNMFNAELYKLVSMQGGFFSVDYHLHILTSKLYGLSYYPVSWMEDRLVLTRLIHRDTFAKIMVFQSYVGGALSSLDLAGGHIPGIDVRPGVILMGYNITSFIGYVLYYKYLSYKLGFNDPEKMKAYIEKKEKAEMELQLKVKEISEQPWFEGWEDKYFYDHAVKSDDIEEINKLYKESLELIPEVRRTLETMTEFFWLGEGHWLKKDLLKAKSIKEIDEIKLKVERKLRSRPNYQPQRRLYSPYKANCFPSINTLIN